MKSYNHVTLLGNVANEPECKDVQTAGGTVCVARFSIATSNGGYTKKDGTEVPEETMFHRITAWRSLADVCKKFIHKGDTVFVTGEIKYSQVDNNGTKVTYTDIIADNISICRSKNGEVQQPVQQVQQQPDPFQQPYTPYPPQQPYNPYPPQQPYNPYPPQGNGGNYPR